MFISTCTPTTEAKEKGKRKNTSDTFTHANTDTKGGNKTGKRQINSHIPIFLPGFLAHWQSPKPPATPNKTEKKALKPACDKVESKTKNQRGESGKRRADTLSKNKITGNKNRTTNKQASNKEETPLLRRNTLFLKSRVNL